MAEVEKVIRELSDSKQNLHCGFVDGIGDVYAVSEETINNALELLNEKQKYKWTSVEERMPEKEGFYLVSAKHGDFHPWVAEMKIFMGIKGFCNGATMPVVGAWMPLPKPYGVKKDGEQE